MNNNKNIDLMIEETKQSLIDIINDSGLPISIICYIVSDICGNVENAKMRTLEMLKSKKEELEDNK